MSTNDAGEFSRDSSPLSHDPLNTVDADAPGVQAHMPGEDNTDSSVGGLAPGGSALEQGGEPGLPAEDGLSNAGDSLGGDDESLTSDPSDDAGFGADDGVGDGTGLGEGNGNAGQASEDTPSE